MSTTATSNTPTDKFMRNTTQPGSMRETLEGLDMSQRQATIMLPKNRENDPTALDVISDLINPNEEAKASVYMKGHIDQETINETFLMNA